MNENIELLKRRRSIRNYSDTPLTEEEYQTLVEVAMYAPTAKNMQPWHFIIIKDRAILDAFIEIHPHSSMLKYADGAIMVCGDTNIQNEELGYLYLDGAAATMNILHAAHAMGIGSCWIGIYPKEDRMQKVTQLVGLPENILPISLIALGNTDVEKDLPERIKLDRIHKDRW